MYLLGKLREFCLPQLLSIFRFASNRFDFLVGQFLLAAEHSSTSFLIRVALFAKLFSFQSRRLALLNCPKRSRSIFSNETAVSFTTAWPF